MEPKEEQNLPIEKGYCECDDVGCLCKGNCKAPFTFWHPAVMVDTQLSDYPEILCAACAECLLIDLEKR